MAWRPGDQLPDWWELPTSCPAGHPWGPGRQTTSWSRGRLSTQCHPPGHTSACPWRWVQDERTGEEWTRVQMPGRWHPHTGQLAPTGDAEVMVDGKWRRGIVGAWLPVPGNGWEAETRVDLGSGGYAVTLRVKPDRIRSRTTRGASRPQQENPPGRE